MGVRTLRMLAGLAALTVVGSGAASSTVASREADNWVGDRYGWRTNLYAVQATTDGGRNWHEIFYTDGSGDGDLAGALQTGPRIGVVDATVNGFIDDRQWTVDNGKHWYELDRTDAASQWGEGVNAFDGHGRYLFWTLDDRHGNTSSVMQVTPWPPRGAYLECPGGYTHDDVDGLFCYRARRMLHQVRLAEIPNAHSSGQSGVPGGEAFLFGRASSDGTAPLFRVLIRRNGHSRLVALPALPAADEQAIGAYGNLEVDWPELKVTAPSFEAVRSNLVAVWTSYDAGQKWSVATYRVSPEASGGQ